MKKDVRFLDPNTPASHVYGLMLKTTNSNNKIFHSHNYCEIMLIISGKLLHRHNGATTILSEKTLCFVRDHDLHSCSSYNGDEVCFFNIGIPFKILSQLEEFYGVNLSTYMLPKHPPSVKLNNVDFQHLVNKINIFLSIDFNELHARTLYSLLSEMFYYIITPTKSDIQALYNPETPQWLLNLLFEMSKKENFIGGLPTLLSMITYSQEYVTRCFKKYINMTPTQYINSLRLTYAKKLLLEEHMVPENACFESGFNSMSYFNKEFHKMYLCTPRQLINNHKIM